MIITKIGDCKYKDTDYLIIYFDDGTATLQRKNPHSAMDSPISPSEELTISLCGRIKTLESAVQEFNFNLRDMRTTGRFNNLKDLKSFINQNEEKFKRLLKQ